MKLPYDPAISPGIYPKKMKTINSKRYAPLINKIITLFKYWETKNLKCTSMDKQIKKLYIYVAM